jgi:hypothetical protein
MNGREWGKTGGQEEDGGDGPDNMGRGETTRMWSKEKQAMWTRPAAGCVRNNNAGRASIRFAFWDTTCHVTVIITTSNNASTPRVKLA